MGWFFNVQKCAATCQLVTVLCVSRRFQTGGLEIEVSEIRDGHQERDRERRHRPQKHHAQHDQVPEREGLDPREAGARQRGNSD